MTVFGRLVARHGLAAGHALLLDAVPAGARVLDVGCAEGYPGCWRGAAVKADHGLFDRTHLRFYTRGSARALLEGAGLRVVGEAFAPAPLPLESRLPALGRLGPRLVRARHELFALQVVLQAEPGPDARTDPVKGSDPVRCPHELP